MERCEFPLPSRKNSNEESQVSTRQQLNIKEDQPPTLQLSRQMHTYQLEVSPLGANSHHVNSLMLNEETVKPNRECPLTDKRTYQLEWQLRGERHKVARLRQIIRVKTEKQQQLERAYVNIAIELKKKMEASTLARSKISEPDTNPPNNAQSLLSRFGRQVESLEMDVKRLMGEVQYWKGESQRKVVEAMGSEIAQLQGREGDHVSEDKHMNMFYVKEIERLQRKIQELEFQLNPKETGRESMEISADEIERVCSVNNSISQSIQKKKIKSSCLSEKLGVVSSRSVREVAQSQNQEQFMSFQEISPLIEKKLSFQRRQNEILQPQQNLESNHRLPLPDDVSFQTVKDPVDDSFQSIHSKPQPSRLMYSNSQDWSDLNLESFAHRPSEESSLFHSIMDGSQFRSVSNVPSQISNNSSLNESLRSIVGKSVLQIPAINEQMLYEIPHQTYTCRELPHQGQRIEGHELKQELECSQQKMIKLKDEVQHFINKIAGKVSQFTEQLFMGQPIHEHSLVLHWKREIDPSNFFSTDQIERFLADLEQLLSKAVRWSRNRYQKLSNDRELQQWQAKTKMQTYESDIDNLRQKVQFLLEYNRKLQFEVAELSSLNFGNSPSEHTERINYMRAIYRSKISLVEPAVTSQLIQCDLIPSNSAQLKEEEARSNNYRQALVHLNDEVNQIIQRTRISHEPFQLNFNGCLRTQVDRMLESAFDAINSYSPSKRRPSMSLENSPKKLLQTEDVDEIDMLIAENEQLRVRETEKSCRISQVKSELQKQKKQLEMNERLIEELRGQIEELHAKTENMATSPPRQPQRHSMNPYLSSSRRLDRGEFMDFSVIREFNNMNWSQDEEMRLLRNELEACREELEKYKKQRKKAKKHIFYVSN